MLAVADEVAKPTVGQLADLRALLHFKAFHTEKAIDRVGRLEHFKLSVRIGPGVLDRIAEQNRTRRAQCDEAVLVERQTSRVVVELLEVAAKPMRKRSVDPLYRFADL